MIKLYRKSELYFALVCIGVYVLVFGNLRSLGDDSLYNMLGLLVISGLLFAFVRKYSLTEKYGLDGQRIPDR